MLKTTLRFLVVTLIAVALGALIYHFNQASATSSVASFSRELGEGGFHDEGGFGLLGGLFGVGGNLLLVAAVTAIVVTIQKSFGPRRALARAR